MFPLSIRGRTPTSWISASASHGNAPGRCCAWRRRRSSTARRPWPKADTAAGAVRRRLDHLGAAMGSWGHGVMGSWGHGVMGDETLEMRLSFGFRMGFLCFERVLYPRVFQNLQRL